MAKVKLICQTPLYKVMLIREKNVPVQEKIIRKPEDAAGIATEYLKGADREHLVGLYLSTANKLIAIHTISIGILNASLVHPREVFKMAIMVNADSVIVAHNHPSGNLEPSREDIDITKQLKDAGKILDIELRDHLVVSDGCGYMSFKERGLI
ncbi:MAG TPA: DNA repair protein RadC [Candidatus Acidoferrales bacterium]|nr:DNA repair protein RadC [Candidatus Acidoferrales bacterium]